MKTCFKCKQEKSIAEFYTHRKMADGHLGKCKSCTKTDVSNRIDAAKRNPEWVAKERERCRHKSIKRRDLGIEKPRDAEYLLEVQRRNRKRHPDRDRARRILGRAIKSGAIIRPSFCGECFTPCKPDGHHDDYSKPLDVRWLCEKCHYKITRKPLSEVGVEPVEKL